MTQFSKAILLGIVTFIVLVAALWLGANLGYQKAMSDVVIMQEQAKKERELKEREMKLEKKEKGEVNIPGGF